MTAALRGKQLRHLRARAHGLEPVVLLGREGITDGIVHGIGEALDAHELVKVRLPELAGAARKAAAGELAERCGAKLVQVLGRVVVLYRANENGDGSRVQLPD